VPGCTATTKDQYFNGQLQQVMCLTEWKLLASSDAKRVQEQKDTMAALGIPTENIQSLAYKRQERYYPFGEHMFFWTGDANTGIFTGVPMGILRSTHMLLNCGDFQHPL